MRERLMPARRPARNTSTRMPAAAAGTTSSVAAGRSGIGVGAGRARRTVRIVGVVEHEKCEDDRDADADAAVGDVERREPADIDEVGHFAETHAVDEVPDGTAELHAEGDADDAVVHRRVEVIEHDRAEPEDAGDDQERRLALEDAERGAAVDDVDDADGPEVAVPLLIERQVRAHEMFGVLVGGDDDASDEEE